MRLLDAKFFFSFSTLVNAFMSSKKLGKLPYLQSCFAGTAPFSALSPDGHLKIPWLWPGQNPTPSLCSRTKV
jgi:hypothetical protein